MMLQNKINGEDPLERIILEILPDDKVSKYSPKYVSLVIIKRRLQVRTILGRGMEMTSVLGGNGIELKFLKWNTCVHKFV